MTLFFFESHHFILFQSFDRTMTLTHKVSFHNLYNIVPPPPPLCSSQGYPQPNKSFRALTQTRVGLSGTNSDVLFFPCQNIAISNKRAGDKKKPKKCSSKVCVYELKRGRKSKKKKKPKQERRGGEGGGGLSKWLFYIPCVRLKWKVTPDK